MSDKQKFDDLLEELTSRRDVFRDFVTAHAVSIFHDAGLKPGLSEQRIVDAFEYWTGDLKRNEVFNMDSGRKPDIFKICGYLTYSLRRFQPIVRIDVIEPIELDRAQRSLREMLTGFGSEYFAFNVGLGICRAVEEVERPNAPKIVPTAEFIHDICFVLKFKNVSPHALYMIFKALFLR